MADNEYAGGELREKLKEELRRELREELRAEIKEELLKEADSGAASDDEQPDAPTYDISRAGSGELVDDDWAEFRKMSEEEQKWALIQLQLDREQRYIESIFTPE